MINLKVVSAFFFFLIASIFLDAHEGHHLVAENAPIEGEIHSHNSYIHIIHWIGRYHLIFLHFPIALINMTAISELLFARYRNPLFDHASRFMLIAAAITAVPTVLLGFAFAHQSEYGGMDEILFWWHRFFGIVTAALAIVTLMLKERYLQGSNTLKLYYGSLALLFVCVNLAGFFGGKMAFGF